MDQILEEIYSSRQDPFEEEHFLEALSNEWKINVYLDILLAGSGEEIAQFFMDKRKEVEKIEQRMEEYQRGVLEEIREDCRGGNAEHRRDPRITLEVTEKGRIRQSIQNCKHVLDHDPCLRGAVCRNEMTCQIDIKKKVPWKRRGVQMTDTDMNNLSSVSGKELRADQ